MSDFILKFLLPGLAVFTALFAFFVFFSFANFKVNDETKNTASNYIGVVTTVIGIFVTLLFAITFYKSDIFYESNFDNRCNEIRNVIINGASEEFNAYKNLDSIELSKQNLEEYFVVNGPTYNKIVQVLEKTKLKKRMISNESSFEVTSTNCEFIEDSTAMVKVMEFWHLDWYDIESNELKSRYSVQNSNTYIMKKETNSNKWKILLQYYETAPKRDNLLQ